MEIETILTRTFAIIWFITIPFVFVAIFFLTSEWFFIGMVVQLFSVFVVKTLDQPNDKDV